MRDVYREIYSQDFNTENIPHGHINWKDTSVCISLFCQCGHEGHFDGDYFGFYKCPHCDTKYAIGQVVKLIPLDMHQSKEIGECRFKTCMISTGEIIEYKQAK